MGHYSYMFNEQSWAELLELCTKLQGKSMLTMYSNAIIQQYADINGWIIHKVDRQVSAARQHQGADKRNGWCVIFDII